MAVGEGRPEGPAEGPEAGGPVVAGDPTLAHDHGASRRRLSFVSSRVRSVDGNGSCEDPLDVETLYRRDAGAIRRYARRAGLSAPDAEDVAQATFLRAIELPPSPNDSASPGRAWLHTVAANLMRDRWRRAGRAPTVEPGGDVLLTTQTDLPEDAAIAEMERGLVRKALSALPAEARRILVMRIVEGRSSAEVAELLGRTPDGVRQAQLRALRSLERQLRALGWNPHDDGEVWTLRGGGFR